ncbi:outer membrane beta-barrel protein [uncultured Cyclobacterium sp.]|uniref:outer membrane beta-barrel protein n=1 Tax=uncultured Cyclobacterium sp. TaxID=453820 RepID=UPI0030ECFBE7|tara:strand:- start:6620 stop:9382 length:2763 start_codon:yes stop_codon:yes gene_type:complete
MNKIVLLLFIIFFIHGNLRSQSNLRGKVQDKETSETLPGAYVFVKNAAGDTLANTFTDEYGQFQFANPKVSSFILNISFIGFEDLIKTVATPTNNNLGIFELVEEGSLLEAYEIEASTLAGEMKGDTISMNADAFKTRSQASAGELIRKMPGVVMRGNTIEVQGETVGQVLVDGEPFFGDDPAMAMQNLPVEIIDRIEFLDQLSVQAQLTGFDDGETIKTINIITKKEKRGGEFGRMFAGYGSNNNYLIGGSVNFFDGPQRLTLLGLSNNINQQNFSADDLTGAFGGGDDRRGGRGRGGNPLTTRELPGVTNTNAVGINFTDKFNNGKAKLTGSYFFNESTNFLNQNSSREYILSSDSLQLYDEIRNEENYNQNHRLDLRLDYDISDKHAIVWRPRVRYEKGTSKSRLAAQNLFNPNTPINETQNNTSSTNESFQFSSDFTYRYKFNKKGRTLSTQIETEFGDANSDSRLVSVNRDFQTNNLDSLIQNSLSKSNSFNYELEVEYTEPIGEYSQLRFEYEVGNDIGTTKQEVAQRAMESNLFELDSTLTNEFENTYLQHEAGLGYSYNKDKIRVYSSFDYQISILDSDRLFPGFENTKRTFKNFVPRMVFMYDMNDNTNIRIYYRGDTDAPSVRQLQDVIDNSNPIQISTGNPDLEQEYEHRLYTRIRNVDPETSKSFFMYMGGSVRSNYLGNATYIATKDTLIQGDVLLRQGGQLSRPENLDKYWDLRSYFSFGIPLKFIKSNLDLSARASFSNQPGIINGQTNYNRNIGLGPGIGISSNLGEDLDFNISTSGNYNIVRSSLQENLDNNYYTQSTRLDLYWNFAWGFFVSTNVNNQWYTGLGEDFDQSVWLMNADLGYRFPPSQKFELKMTVFDLLNQNTNISRNVTDVYIENERTQVLQQFLMLTLTYNLRSFGQGAMP